MQAPSACNQQPWEFYVVTDKEKILELSKATPYSGCAAGAPVVIVPVYRKEGLPVQDMAQIDMSIAQENIWLETDALGLGGVWIGIAPLKDRMALVHDILKLPENVEVFSHFCPGIPSREQKAAGSFDKSRIHFVESKKAFFEEDNIRKQKKFECSENTNKSSENLCRTHFA